ncbi:phasin family protein [Methylocapsa sp. D3K7]|uniref:phasin family protein n=1 Tax=Methylocapsa sp. D3K7 TaxID=3041435 RepID=UPI00244E98A3|nr:phasin family protein [Methylocapsa sp. D3K7]WGJ13396.1 phasin family protein [Methylocapsa sp. D3K7]
MDKNAETTEPKPAGIPKKGAQEAFRESAEKGMTQAKETYEKMDAATTEASDLIKNSYSTVLKGMKDYNNKIIEFARANTNTAFDFVQEMSSVKSPTVFIELWKEHSRKQAETLTGQTKELTVLAKKLMTETPLKAGVVDSFNRAA